MKKISWLALLVGILFVMNPPTLQAQKKKKEETQKAKKTQVKSATTHPLKKTSQKTKASSPQVAKKPKTTPKKPKTTPKKASSTTTKSTRSKLVIPFAKKRWKVSIKGAPMRGDKKAFITIVEFSDFQCPYCAMGSTVLKNILKKYKGKVRLVYKHFPLSFHPDAHLTAQASIAAHAQGKFWQYHDKVFANRKHLKRADLEKYAKELKLDMKKFNEALDKGIYKKLIAKDLKEGLLAHLEGTPTAYINGIKTWLDPKRIEMIIKMELQWIEPYKKQGWTTEQIYAEIYKQAHIYHAPLNDVPLLRDEKYLSQFAQWGSSKALATITLFCNYRKYQCLKYNRYLYTLKKLYKKNLRVVFRFFNIEGDNAAQLAAKAALAAHKQGKFVEFNQLLFEKAQDLKLATLLKLAKKLKLNIEKFKKDLASTKIAHLLKKDEEDLAKWYIEKPPVFYINGQRLAGKISLEGLKGRIDAVLLKKGFNVDQLPKLPERHIPIAGSPVIGAQKPFATIVIFSDFQCPYCRKAAKNLRPVIKAYGKYIRFVFKHFPLSFHRYARLAAQASMAAHAQGKFWQYHDLLFDHQQALARADLERYAQQLKLDMKKFKAALDKKTYLKKIAQDFNLGLNLEVQGTPTFFLNGKKLKAYTFMGFKKYLDPILLKHGVKKADLPKAPPVDIPLFNSPWKGAKKPLITIVEFSDFQCPFCSRASQLLNKIIPKYKKYVRLVFKNFPLGFHKYAYPAALAAQAAHAQGKFWAYHDKLFANQAHLTQKDLLRYARELKLDMKKFKGFMNNRSYKRNVVLDYILGIKLHIQGTPSFFLNGRPVEIYDLNKLKKLLDEKLLQLGVKKSHLPK